MPDHDLVAYYLLGSAEVSQGQHCSPCGPARWESGSEDLRLGVIFTNTESDWPEKVSPV